MTKFIHPVAGAVALLVISTFWLATIASEAFLAMDTVIAVKTTIPYGFILLVPALAMTGGSGFKLAEGRRTDLIATKIARMRFAAINGLFVLIPSALFLAYRAEAGLIDGWFYGVQGIELLAGSVNICLLGLNMHDGFALGRTHGRRNGETLSPEYEGRRARRRNLSR
ncbi:hypothetical protein [Hwanghaeella grinnelliae]|uniref:hypothetical protein n=1 Tax=Hwanghaeella grinnelliae TaxID=2500179 RepID=UPI001960DB2D|nr:hypothetical protein [Hwanghaeella grinnelliae]